MCTILFTSQFSNRREKTCKHAAEDMNLLYELSMGFIFHNMIFNTIYWACRDFFKKFEQLH